MASIQKAPGKPFYFCAFASWDTEAGQSRRHFKSTGTANRREALEICRTWDNAAKAARNGRLTPDSAREIIARGVADVFTAANREHLPSRSVRDWCAAWLVTKRLEAAENTITRYAGIIERFTAFLGKKADRDLASVTAADVGSFRDGLANDLSRNSANLAVKTLRVCLGSALKQGLVKSNVASNVGLLKARGGVQRRGFTLKEIARVLKAAEGSEWYGMTLAGLYCGARLGDYSAADMALGGLEHRDAFIRRQKDRKPCVHPAGKGARASRTRRGFAGVERAMMPPAFRETRTKRSKGRMIGSEHALFSGPAACPPASFGQSGPHVTRSRGITLPGLRQESRVRHLQFPFRPLGFSFPKFGFSFS